jgi:hypothetical protein
MLPLQEMYKVRFPGETYEEIDTVSTFFSEAVVREWIRFYSILWISAMQASMRLREMGMAVLSSWANSDTLYSSIIQPKSSRARRFSSDARAGSSRSVDSRHASKSRISLPRSRAFCRITADVVQPLLVVTDEKIRRQEP